MNPYVEEYHILTVGDFANALAYYCSHQTSLKKWKEMAKVVISHGITFWK